MTLRIHNDTGLKFSDPFTYHIHVVTRGHNFKFFKPNARSLATILRLDQFLINGTLIYFQNLLLRHS